MKANKNIVVKLKSVNQLLGEKICLKKPKVLTDEELALLSFHSEVVNGEPNAIREMIEKEEAKARMLDYKEKIIAKIVQI